MRRSRLVGGGLFAAGVVVVGLGTYGWLAARSEAARDVRGRRGANVLLVTLDTTRADHLGCYGAGKGVTPVLDGLAARGVQFMQAQAAAPITLPSHTSMLTGLYPPEHGLRNNGMFALGPDTPTLATLLGDRGYHTGAFVSASVLARRYGLATGFEIYDDDLSKGQVNSATVPSRRGGLTVDAALGWLKGLPSDEPFFAWVHLYDPHAPYDPPDEYRQRFPSDPYTGEIAYADAQVGRLLAYLHDSGREDDTLVVVVADHGEALGEHGEQTHAVLLHQATLHVPWIMAGVDLPKGVKIPTAVTTADLLPTVWELVGLHGPRGVTLDGESDLPLIRGGPAAARLRSLYAETLLPEYQYGWSPLRLVRRGRWELVQGARAELFNLVRDPRELADVADRNPETVRSLGEELKKLTAGDAGAADHGEELKVSRSEMEMLRSLGYLGAEGVDQRRDSPDPRDLIEAHVHMERGRSLLAQGLLPDAEHELDAMLALDPQNISALTLRAQVLMQEERFDEARTTLEHCLEVDPDGAAAYRMLAQLELQRGHADAALKLAKAGATKRGAFETMTAIQATAMALLGRQEEARALLDEHLAASPDDPDLLVARARFDLAAGDAAAAEGRLRRSVGVDALQIQARLMLERLLESQGRRDEAAALMEEYLKVDPANEEALLALGRLRMSDPSRARPYLEEAVRVAPGRPEPLLALAACSIQLGDGQRAETVLRRALELDPENRDALNNLGIALTLQARYADAERTLGDLLAKHPAFAEARNNLALCLLYQGRLPDAEREVRRALKDRPGLRDGRLTLASILQEGGRTGEAVTVLRKLLKVEPDSSDLKGRLGVTLTAARSYREALPLLREAMPALSGNLDVVRALARCEEEAGERSAATRLYQRLARQESTPARRKAASAALDRLAVTTAAR